MDSQQNNDEASSSKQHQRNKPSSTAKYVIVGIVIGVLTTSVFATGLYFYASHLSQKQDDVSLQDITPSAENYIFAIRANLEKVKDIMVPAGRAPNEFMDYTAKTSAGIDFTVRVYLQTPTGAMITAGSNDGKITPAVETIERTLVRLGFEKSSEQEVGGGAQKIFYTKEKYVCEVRTPQREYNDYVSVGCVVIHAIEGAVAKYSPYVDTYYTAETENIEIWTDIRDNCSPATTYAYKKVEGCVVVIQVWGPQDFSTLYFYHDMIEGSYGYYDPQGDPRLVFKSHGAPHCGEIDKLRELSGLSLAAFNGTYCFVPGGPLIEYEHEAED
jgi:hypothetical protein